jgi:hypothetical protein
VPNNNPGGENGTGYFDGFGGESAYGAVKRLTDTIKAAPIPVNPAIRAPERARKQQGQQQQQQQAPPQPSAEQQLAVAPPPPARMWDGLETIPGINLELIAWLQSA